MNLNSFFDIDFNTQKLISLFSSLSDIIKNLTEIERLIGEINEYQFLYFLNSIDLRFLDNNLTINTLIHLKEMQPYDSTFNNGRKSFHCLGFKYKSTEIENFISKINPIKSIIDLINFDKTLTHKTTPLINDVRKKLLDAYNKKDIPCSFGMDFTGFDEYGFRHIDHINFEDKIDRFTNKTELLVNELCFFDFERNCVTNLDIDIYINSISKSIRTIYYDYDQKEIDYNIELISPLVFGISFWKKQTTQKLSNSKSKEDFQSKSSFFVEILRQLSQVLQSDSINLKHSNENKLNTNRDLLDYNGYAIISKMIQFIKNIEYLPKSNFLEASKNIDLSSLQNVFSNTPEVTDKIFQYIVNKDFEAMAISKEKLTSTKNGIKTSEYLFKLNTEFKIYSIDDLKTLYKTGIVYLINNDKSIDYSLFRKAKLKYPLLD